ncbi:MAG: aminomethyltransferase family protein [Leucothrix sp.]
MPTEDNSPTQSSSKLVHARSHPTVRINSKRFEQSPYAPAYMQDDTLLGCYCNRFYPISFGDDVLAQYWKLRRDVMLFDVPEKPLEISGPDAVTLLEKVLTRRVANLQQGRAHYAIACTPQGGVLMDGVLIRLADDRFWYVQANGEFETWLIAHSEGLDVEVSDPKSRVLQIQGPKSLEVLAAATSADVPEDFTWFKAATFNFGGQDLLVTRTGWTGELGFEIYSDAQTDHLALWDHLIAAGAPFGMENAALEVMGIRRVEAGILDYGTDINRSMSPFAVGLGKFVDFSKDDFVGKAALEKLPQGERLLGVVCEAGVATVGCTLWENGQQVGHIRVGDWSPTLEKSIAYVLFDEVATEASPWVGKTLTLRDAEGQDFDCEVVRLPFYDKEKRIPRGQ